MGLKTGEDPPPRSDDLGGWRRAVEDGRFRGFRMEEIVAAIQDLGPGTDTRVLNPLALHLSDVMLGLLRRRVDTGYPNQGRDVIERVHGQLVEAVFTPGSPDGKGLRSAFASRIEFRIKDALVAEKRAARDLREPADHGGLLGTSGDGDLPRPDADAAQRYHDPSSEIAENMDVENVLRRVADDQKRLAFRLHMDGVPYKSTKTPSIATVLGIDEKTARDWIKEVKALLSTAREVQDLIESRRRAAP